MWKHYTCLLLFVQLLSAHGQWTQVTSPTPANLWSIKFFDDNVGYINSNVFVLKTTDGGETWATTSHLGNVNGDFSFPTGTVGYFAGFYDLIKKTTDQGVTWTSIVMNNQALPIYSVSFVDANIGYAIGANGLIRKTTNGGATWTAQSTSGSPDLRHVHFVNENLGTAIGLNGAIRRTTNGGASWPAITGAAGSHLNDIFFLDSNIGFIVGGQGRILKTTDGGANWVFLNSGTTQHLSSVCFRNALEGYVGGSSGFMMKTTDGGMTWTEENNPFFLSTQTITDIVFKNGYYIAIGSAGKITRTAVATSIPSLEENGSAFELFPNPASNEVVVRGVEHSDRISQVRVYDLSGALVRASDLPMGQYRMDVSDLDNGMYMVHVGNEHSMTCLKLVVQH